MPWPLPLRNVDVVLCTGNPGGYDRTEFICQGQILIGKSSPRFSLVTLLQLDCSYGQRPEKDRKRSPRQVLQACKVSFLLSALVFVDRLRGPGSKVTVRVLRSN